MKICKKKYRIVSDNYSGFEVQKKIWWFPFWFQISGLYRANANTSRTILIAEELIQIDREKRRDIVGKVVKTYNCEQLMKLGNLIERITYYTGIKYIWKKIYPNCKCEERQKNLNDIELWQKIN